jgi:hypothetical protein
MRQRFHSLCRTMQCKIFNVAFDEGSLKYWSRKFQAQSRIQCRSPVISPARVSALVHFGGTPFYCPANYLLLLCKADGIAFDECRELKVYLNALYKRSASQTIVYHRLDRLLQLTFLTQWTDHNETYSCIALKVMQLSL